MVRLGQRPINPWVGGVLFSMADSIKKTSQFFEYFKVSLIFPPKKIREQKFENALFSPGDEMCGDITSGKGHFEYPGSFRVKRMGM
jgi:hypothetical protein